MSKRPDLRLVDIMRDREDEISGIAARMLDAMLVDEYAPADILAGSVSALAALIVQFTPTDRVNRRTKDSEALLRRSVRKMLDRADGPALADGQRLIWTDLTRAFSDSFREISSEMPIPPAFIAAGCDAEHYRKVLMSHELQERLVEVFSRTWTNHSPDRLTAVLSTVCAAAVICGAPVDTNDPDPEGYVEIMVDEFRETLVKTLAYWREKGAN